MPKPPEIHAHTIDIGTSTIKTPSDKIPFEKNTVKLQGIPEFTVLKPTAIDHYARRLSEEYRARHSNVLGLTGFGHSLVVEYRNGASEAFFLGDDPSATPGSGLPETLEPHFPEMTTPKVSAIRKLAAVQEHPEIVSEILGHDIDPDNLFFNTFLSFMAGKISGQRLGISPDESKDFKLKSFTDREISVHEVLQIKPHQLPFESEDTVYTEAGEIWVMQDLHVESIIHAELFRRHVYNPGAWVMITDSVLKRLRLTNDHHVTDRIEGLYYDKMRQMGKTAETWTFPMLISHGVDLGKGDMYLKYETSMRHSSLPVDWFFDPTGNNDEGALYHKEHNSWRRVDQNLVGDIPADRLDAAVRSVGWGISCAMYENMPTDVEDVYICGGLMGLFGRIQPGWGHAFIEAAPEGKKVHWTNMPDAGVAMNHVIRMQKGEPVDLAKEIPIRQVGTGKGVSKHWFDLKREVELKAVAA